MSGNDLLDLNDLANSFEIKNISSSPSKFDMDQMLFWQKKAVEKLTIEDFDNWLSDSLTNLPSEINKKGFIELIKENINFPIEAEEYLHKLFLKPLVDEKEIAEIISSAGKEFYLEAHDVISQGISDWNECVKKIGNQSGKKGRELFMPLRVAITGQTKGPELDKVVELIGPERILKGIKEASEL